MIRTSHRKNNPRHMQITLIILLVLAIFGLLDTSYLIKKRKSAAPPVCPIGGHCNLVLESKYNTALGVHLDLLGFLYYAGIITLTLLTISHIWNPELLTLLLQIGIAAGVLTSIMLVLTQWLIIKAWCFWCTISALLSFTMGLTLMITYYA